jgi:hypothetical protein
MLGWHMTSIDCRGSLIALVLALVLVVAGCAKPVDQSSNESCETKASKAALDESCVIELSKKEIATRLNGTVYGKYQVTFDPVEKLWIVMAYNEKGPPDSHVYLSITPTGEVKDLRGAP